MTITVDPHLNNQCRKNIEIVEKKQIRAMKNKNTFVIDLQDEVGY